MERRAAGGRTVALEALALSGDWAFLDPFMRETRYSFSCDSSSVVDVLDLDSVDVDFDLSSSCLATA